MRLERAMPYKVFECVAGSVAYGTDVPESDVDVRGAVRIPGGGDDE